MITIVQEVLHSAEAGAAVNGTAIDMRGVTALVANVTISATGTVVPEGSVDGGTTWFTVQMNRTDTGAGIASIAASLPVSMPSQVRLTNFRMRISANSGTITVKTVKDVSE